MQYPNANLVKLVQFKKINFQRSNPDSLKILHSEFERHAAVRMIRVLFYF